MLKKIMIEKIYISFIIIYIYIFPLHFFSLKTITRTRHFSLGITPSSAVSPIPHAPFTSIIKKISMENCVKIQAAVLSLYISLFFIFLMFIMAKERSYA